MGLQFPYYGAHVTLLWIPAAIALAALVLRGPAVIPGVFVGSLGLNLTTDPSNVGQSIAIAAGNTLGPALSSYLLVRVARFESRMDRVRDGFAYVGIGVLATSAFTATFGALSLYAFGTAPATDLPNVWVTWLGGDAAGLLIVGPLILTWLSPPDPALVRPIANTEKAALGLSIILFSAIVLASGSRIPSLPYAFGPLFVWSLLRLGPRGVSLAVAVVSISLMAGTALGVGPFMGKSVADGMLALWVFLAGAGSAGVISSALISERDRAVMNQTRLMRELDHRVKNTLATVIALAERSSDSASDIHDYVARFVSRLRAVARTHEGMAQSNWNPMDLAEVLTMTLAPFEESVAIEMSTNRDRVTIEPTQVTPLTMLLHELATNAAKHGAWSRPDGRVAVAWQSSASGSLVLSWRETGGPGISSPPNPGYGLRLIEGLANHELGGRAELEFTEDGLVCRVHIPLRG